MNSQRYIAGEDLKAGQIVYISEADGLIYADPNDRDGRVLFTIDQDVKKGEVITMPLQLGALDRKEWAVIHDTGASCDLTYQEAQQMCTALRARDINSATIVTNRVGKLANDKGYLRTSEQN
jgi:hypothetical protein